MSSSKVSKAFLCLSVLLVTAIVPVRGLERDIDPALAVHGEDLAPAEAEPAQEPSKADLFFERAIDIRDSRNPSDKELRRSVELLYAAAGIEHLSIGKPNRTDSATIDSGEEPDRAAGQGGYLTAADVKVRWRNGSIQHEGAVRELIFVFREGDGVPINPAIAHRLLEELAAAGNPEAQADVGAYLAIGLAPVAPNAKGHIFTLVEPDLPAALVHYYFAATAGDPIAQMALGYRHMHGHGVVKSCQTAALYYLPVAEKVLEMAKMHEGLPELRTFRLSHKSAHSRPQPNAEQEFLHYKWFADYGHADAARAVAHLLANRGVREYEEAVRYLRQAADAGDVDAMAHLGHIYANGIAVEQSNSTAWRWFWRAAEQGHPAGMFGLGYMHLTGQGAEVDHKQALDYFRHAVEAGQDWQGLGDGLFYLGLMHLKGWGTPADITQAVAFFGMSSRAGNLLAAYNLAVLHLREMAGEKGAEACASAVGLLKRVAERGWPVLAEAADDFTMGDYEWALLNYLKASEWGSELGQSNAAWMLLDGYGYDGPRAGETAVSLLKRAAEQGNTAALVHIGDSYWYGKGVPRDWDKAGRVYAEAAKHREGQALFNLGYMHQYGAGVPKDFHLAKRYYDRAAEASPDGSFAVALALGVMRLHAWWDRVEPSLPRRWAWLWKDLLVVKQSDGEVGAIKAHASAPHGVLGRARRLFSLGTVIDLLDALDSSFNATLVTWLVGALVLVLLRRQAVRARQQGRPQVPPMVPQAPVQPAPVPAPAAEEVPATAPATTPPQQQPEEREEERLPAERLPEANVLRDGPSDGNTDA